MIHQKVYVTADKFGIPPTVHMVQGDTGRVLDAEYKDYTLTGSESATLLCERPNGTHYIYSGTISTESNEASFEMDAQEGALTRDGIVKAQVILTKDGEVVSSFDVNIAVEKSRGGVLTEDDVTYVTQMIRKIDETTEAISNAEKATTDANNAAGNASDAAEDANTAATGANTAAATANAAAEAVSVVTGPFFIVNEKNGKTYNCNIVIKSNGKPAMVYEEMEEDEEET